MSAACYEKHNKFMSAASVARRVSQIIESSGQRTYIGTRIVAQLHFRPTCRAGGQPFSSITCLEEALPVPLELGCVSRPQPSPYSTR